MVVSSGPPSPLTVIAFPEIVIGRVITYSPGATKTVKFTVTVAPGTTDGTEIQNQATVASDQLSLGVTDTTNLAVLAPDLSGVKSATDLNGGTLEVSQAELAKELKLDRSGLDGLPDSSAYLKPSLGFPGIGGPKGRRLHLARSHPGFHPREDLREKGLGR